MLIVISLHIVVTKCFMFRYLDTKDKTFSQEDKDYDRIIIDLENFMEGLHSPEKVLLLKFKKLFMSCVEFI
jgi:hypothetical protein